MPSMLEASQVYWPEGGGAGDHDDDHNYIYADYHLQSSSVLLITSSSHRSLPLSSWQRADSFLLLLTQVLHCATCVVGFKNKLKDHK